ncbi:Ribose import ATP-binding protein RbsA [uncultured Roseburia sp.]|uniref:ABC transporter ATP-binding protein n=1 Tax=Brotonthovivens ammoniilytica TaxID=2981725 RepID=A0ABT2TEX9_9FIRM|nr:ABC transporter ATP-binding protein [Brotonthovivens ammoniilytica]MCU6760745.1 ABC transporter ATP-binding protein [Brotonthovivens ammoniilytica]SCI07919.1 Ribose import ATP-binding protein RbsA [uncultured Roseburia sp.]
MGELILEMKNITKTFGSVVANKDVSLQLYSGEIHALLGENGAGKSTLMNVLTGIYRPDGGAVYYKGKKVSIRSPKQAVNMGIGMVHQHFRLIPTLSVAENVYLYSEDRKFMLNQKKMENVILECSEKFNLSVDGAAKVWQLSVGEQQRVEIIKLLYRGAEILILDEPSAVLTPQEAEEMFKTLRKMADAGKAVIVISHKMNEVMNHANRITVLKGGMVEDTMLAEDATVERLTKAVVGDREFEEILPKEDGGVSKECVLELNALEALNDKGLAALKNITMQVHKGEIFGIAGVAGNGQRELSEVIAGLRPAVSGSVVLKGRDVTKDSIKGRIQNGISFIPEDRLHMGLVPGLNFKENVILKEFDTKKYCRHGMIDYSVAEHAANRFVAEHEIKNGGIDLPVSLMSGGNQQKLLIAREVDTKPSLIVAVYPVRGLDIGAADAIREILMEESRNGTAVILISEELEEIFKMCDRVGVLCNGELMGVRKVHETDFNEIGKMMSGERSEVAAHA